MDFIQWILGGLVGAFITAIVVAFRFGGVFADTKSALALLTKTIQKIEKDHEDHEKENDRQISALWKNHETMKERVIVAESDIKNIREDVNRLEKR